MITPSPMEERVTARLFLFRRELFFETIALFDVANHRDVKSLLINRHFGECQLDRECFPCPVAGARTSDLPSALGELIPSRI